MKVAAEVLYIHVYREDFLWNCINRNFNSDLLIRLAGEGLISSTLHKEAVAKHVHELDLFMQGEFLGGKSSLVFILYSIWRGHVSPGGDPAGLSNLPAVLANSMYV